MGRIFKVRPPGDYPPEDGAYLRGNDFSPVAVVILLHTRYEAIPEFLQNLAKVAVESGAALAGFLQTENIGIEKIVCNIVANPNIRYVVLCGVESAGHWPGDAFQCFMRNGIDERRFIIGSKAPTPYLYNISLEAIERFRRQVSLISLLSDEDRRIRIDPETVRRAVQSCYQEEPTRFLDYMVYDLGAYPEPPICSRITWRVMRPWAYYPGEMAEKARRIREAAELKAREEGETRRKAEESKALLRLLFPRREGGVD